MSRAAGTRRRRGRQSLVRRTNHALVAMLVLSLVTAAVSLGSFSAVMGSVRDDARRSAEATSVLMALPPLFNEAEGAGHDLADTGADAVDYFWSTQDETEGMLDRARQVFGSGESGARLADVVDAWDATYAPLREVAADPELGSDVAASTGVEPSDIHDHLGTEGEGLRSALYTLEETVTERTTSGIDAGARAQRLLSAALGSLFALSLVATVYFGRRIRREVLRPVAALQGSARRFAAGELDHRCDVETPEEFAELAAAFNAMADDLGAQQRTLARRANDDPLTGLANRRCFFDRLEAACAAAGHAETGVGVGVLFVDLDDFKLVNDTLGHAAGDEVLRQVGDRIVGIVRGSDLVARLGGDEFAVLLAAPTSRSVAAATAERVLDALRAPVAVAGSSWEIGASIGVAMHLPETGTAEDLVHEADLAMYRAKGGGKRRVEVAAGA